MNGGSPRYSVDRRSRELRIAVALITINQWTNPSNKSHLPIVGLPSTKQRGDHRSTRKWLATNPHLRFFPNCLARSSSRPYSSQLCDMHAVRPAAGKISVICWPLTGGKRGQTGRIPDFPRLGWASQPPRHHPYIHGEVAVAYGIFSEKMIDGKPHKSYFADYYIWKNGAWHVYFAQQTSFAV